MSKAPEDFKMVEGGERSKSKLVGISMLVLSALLTVSVASLIYLAVTNSPTACDNSKEKTTDVDVKASVNVKTGDNKQVKETIEYNRGKHVAYYHGSDGSFDADDFGKGLHITRGDNGVCFLIPTGTNQSRNDDGLDKFLEEFDGKDVDAQDENVNVEIYDGMIKDTSFLPDRVHRECTQGFKWMAVISKDVADSKTKDDTSLTRDKRAICYRYSYYNYYWYGYYRGQLGYWVTRYRYRIAYYCLG